MKHPSLSVVLPCYNEEAVISRTVAHVFFWMDRSGYADGEVVAVNNGSTDRSPEILHALAAEEPRLRVIDHERNRGYGASVSAGCDAAAGDVIAYMDSDGQFAIEDLDRLLPHLAAADVACGVRSPRADRSPRRFLGLLWRIAVRHFLRIRAADIDCGMKAFRRSVWPCLRPRIAMGDAFNAEFFVRLRLCGYAWAQEPIRHFPRRTGTSSCARPVDMFWGIVSFARLFVVSLFWPRRRPPAPPPALPLIHASC